MDGNDAVAGPQTRTTGETPPSLAPPLTPRRSDIERRDAIVAFERGREGVDA